MADSTATGHLQVRKTQVVAEETRTAAGRGDDGPPLRKVTAAAVVRNPLAGAGFVEDLAALVDGSRELGTTLAQAALAALGGPVESYGKGAISGTAGEQEHANACLT
ncbi:MAG: amino acid synthesis family protein, partial [Acidimicrobiales bacterium]